LNALLKAATAAAYNGTLTITTAMTQLITKSVSLNITLVAQNDIGVLGQTSVIVRLQGDVDSLAFAANQT
jgi:hypothetical protein